MSRGSVVLDLRCK